MQEAALRALGLGDWRYQRLPVPPRPVRGDRSRAAGRPASSAPTSPSPTRRPRSRSPPTRPRRPRAIGAANTLTFADGGIEADNTDAPGLLAALRGPPPGRTALVLGAGGSARAAVWALREAGRRGGGVQPHARRARRRSPTSSAPAHRTAGARRPARQLHHGRPGTRPTRSPVDRGLPARSSSTSSIATARPR